MHWSGLATFWFDEVGPVRAAPVVAGRDDTLQDVFVRGVLPVVLLARGFEALHASAVMVEDRIVALCATSGTGKSTLALALAASGALHFADDTVVYRQSDDHSTALSLPHPVRVEPAARQAAGLASEATILRRVPAGVPAPIHAVYQLVRDVGIDPLTPRFASVPPVRRFEVLLTHAHPFDMGPEPRQRAFIAHLLTLARTVRVWECRFAPSLAALPTLAAAFRAHASRS